ncbi:N-acetyltransferase [Pseudoxanthomonas dokdonensis]|uniref:N-acetyltransferase n=1 Tax=Pseudoxanthomonas dokdonensis TaxID=344882 RepID=UPI000AB8E760|nr:N-acetyltransferase [Pseudoxanthomonas dokdonensis]
MLSSYGIVGQQAPELRVEHWIDGQGQPRLPLRLADFPGQVKIMYCFQSWCPGCHSRGFPTLQYLQRHYQDAAQAPVFWVIQTVFEGHERNGPEQLRIMQQRYQLALPFAQDESLPRPHTMTDYRTGGTPWLIIIGKDDRVLFNDFHVDPAQAVALIDAALADAAPTPAADPGRLEHDPNAGRYRLQVAPGQWAELHYQREGNVLYLQHTEVPAALRGQGHAAVLMERVLEDIERQQLKVVPVCSYTRSYLQRYKRWHDLLAHG